MKKNLLLSFLKKHSTVVVIAVYVLLTIAFTFPLIEKFNSEIPAGRGDTFQAMSNIDSRVQLLTATQGFSNKLTFLVKNVNTFLPYVLLNLVFNKFAAYNLMFLLSFILSGAGMYFLALYFTKNKFASFLAGILFAFAPFHFYEATAVNLGTMHQEWLPFFVLFLFRFFEKFKFKFFVAAVFFAFMIAATEHQFLAFTALFVAFFVIYKVIEDINILKDRKLWLYCVSSILLLGIVAFGMFGQLLKVATSENNFLDPGMNAANKYSMAILDPLAPPAFHAIWPNINSKIQSIVLGDEKKRGSYFIGYTAFVILLFFILDTFRKRKIQKHGSIFKVNCSPVSFWISITSIFYIFSLGPSFSIGKQTVYLPYFLVYKFLPFYENIRTTGRMFVFVLLGLGVLFSYAYVYLSKRCFHKKIIAITVPIFLLMEFWVAPISTMVVSHSAFYDLIGKDNRQYKLIEIPGSTDYGFASYALYTDTIHKKPVLNGMPLARKISGQFDMQQGTPVIKQLLYTIPKGNDPDTKDTQDIIKSFDLAHSNDVLTYYGVKYITISKVYASSEVIKLAQNFIEKHIEIVDKYEDDYLIAYEIKEKIPNGIFWELKGDQISQFNIGKDHSGYREMGNGGALRIVNMGAPIKVKVTLKAKSNTVMTLSSPFDGTRNSIQLNAEEKNYSFISSLTSGENIVPFSVTDSNGKAIVNSNKKKNPTGAMVSSIEILTQE